MGRDETPRPDVPGELTGSQRSGMGAQRVVWEHRFNRAAPRQKLPRGAQLGLGGRSSGWGVGSSACAVSAPVTIRRSDVPHAAEPELGVAKGRSSTERTRRCHGFAKRFVSRPAAHAASGSPFL